MSKIYTFFIDAYKNKDALFTAIGLLLPSLLFCFRMTLWYMDIYLIFPALFGIDAIGRIFEPLIFCYLPSFVTFCFISKKKSIFFFKIYKKISFLFQSFLICGECEKKLYKDWPLGYLLSIAFIFLYLFLLYIDSFFVHLRIPLIYCYGSFCVFLRNPLLVSKNTVFPKYRKFRKINKDLQKKDMVDGRIILSLCNSLMGYILYRENSIMGEFLKLQENICNNLLQTISEKLNEVDSSNLKERFQEIKNKKTDVFDSYKKKLFLHKACLLIFDWKIEPSSQIYKEIFSFYKDLL
nr:hypothetical protein [Trebouxia sp. A1-2]